MFCKHEWELDCFEGFKLSKEMNEYWICKCKKCGKEKEKKFKSKNIGWDNNKRKFLIIKDRF